MFIPTTQLNQGVNLPASLTTHYQVIGTGTYEATVTADRFYFGQTFLPFPVPVLTGTILRCGAVQSGNIRTALIDALGTVVASSNSTVHSGSYAVQAVPFTSLYEADAGVYYLGIIASSATAGFIVIPPLGSSGFTDPGGFTVPASITAPGVADYSGDIPSMATY